MMKEAGVKPGPLTPWDRMKLLAHANTLADECHLTERQIANLKSQQVAGEKLLAALDAGEITETEAMTQMEQIKNANTPETMPPMTKDDVFNQDIGHKLIQKTKSNIEQQEEFVQRVQDAKMGLELAVTTFRKSSLDFLEEMTKYLTDVRQTKVALGTETRQLLAQCQDVRTFFLSPEHTNEVQRLKEFVEICERLKALKESGFLDNVADTILKLAPST